MQSTVFDAGTPCSVEELQNIITFPAGGATLEPRSEYDEVFPGIVVGEGKSARLLHRMEKLGITHILNAAQGKGSFHINTNEDTYSGSNIKFLGVRATDFMNCNIAKYFDEAANFIDKALKKNGRVYVHCVQGVSRSVTLVLAYLMLKQHMRAQDAVRLVRTQREISPNPGFLQQICTLNEKLDKEGHFDMLSNACGGSVVEQDGGGALCGAASGKAFLEENCQEDSSKSNYSTNNGLSGKSEAEIYESKNDSGDIEDSVNRVSEQLSASTSLGASNDIEEGGGGESFCGPKPKYDCSSSKPCTVEELEDILTKPSGGFMMYPGRAYDQINNFIFIGEGNCLKNTSLLKGLGITHVLNCAHKRGVKADAKTMKASGITLCNIEADDRPGFRICKFFHKAADFIDAAVAFRGKVYVNCVMGVSRSATLVLAYLMLRQCIPVQEAVAQVREKREIWPNSDFLQQLCDLNEELKAAGHFQVKLKKKHEDRLLRSIVECAPR